MSRDLNDLVFVVRDAAQKAIVSMIHMNIYVVETRRTIDVQRAYYAQGRSDLIYVNLLRKTAGLSTIDNGENSHTITRCDGIPIRDGGTGVSMHQLGRALDIVPRLNDKPIWPAISDHRWKEISDVMKNYGFTWGGDWKSFPDYPHYEM